MLSNTKASVANTELMECYIAENNDTIAVQLVTDMGLARNELLRVQRHLAVAMASQWRNA
jgi:hypothetical protein